MSGNNWNKKKKTHFRLAEIREIIVDTAPLYHNGLYKIRQNCILFSAIIVGTTAALPTPSTVFKADHPYIYFILYDNTPLFCGIFAG